MKKRDYYEVLGTDKNADVNTIKQAYRKLAMKYHPDRNPGDKQAGKQMSEINEAYAVLCDQDKRRRYDMYGHAGLEGYSSDDLFHGVDFSSVFRDFGMGDFGFGGSIFDSFFSTGEARARGPRRGADLMYTLKVSLEEAAAGVEREIEIPITRTCPSCHGTGAEKGGTKDCDRCRGTGKIITERRSGYGVFRQINVCSKCGGKGKIVEKPCKKCHGRGIVEENDIISISIPGGANTGYKVRVKGKGEEGDEGAPLGDLYIVLEVQEHPIFERHGDDIYMVKEIGCYRATLGGEVNVPGIEGDLKLDIPEGTQNGAVLPIINKGLPHPGGHSRGNQYVMIKVTTPQNLTRREKELFQELEKLQSEEKKN
jgi:molecular chaperone DnaJ